MKNSTLLVVILLSASVFSQIDSTSLNKNNVSAFISDVGTYFYDFDNQKKGYEIPKGSDVHALKNMQFWFATKDANGEIRFSQGGVPGQGRDVFNGPNSHPGTYQTSEYTNNWKQPIWSICQSTIDKYTLHYNCSKDPNCDDQYPMSNEELDQIMNWPAHGNPELGQSYYLAPFDDQPSGDGIYDPTQGDVPKIKGCCATYIIQNDNAQVHTLTNTAPIGIELQILFYQYRTWDYLNNVTFVEVKAINHSNQDYPEFVHSVAIDAALGNETDDFFGSDSLSNTLYFYNADNNDESDSTSFGYGQNPAAIGIVGLNQNMSSAVSFSESESVNEQWNLMKGLKLNGDYWMHPDGFETKYAYSGNPNNTAEWSELSVGNTPGNKKGLLSMDFGNFNDGDTLNQTYAIVYARDGNHIENVETLHDHANTLKSFCINESDVPCTNGTWNVEEQNKFNITVAPNPSLGLIHVKNPNKKKLTVSVYDLQGKVIKKPSTANQKVIDVDLRKNQAGIYLVHVGIEGRVVVKKVVIR